MKVWPYCHSSSGGNVLLNKNNGAAMSCAVYNFSDSFCISEVYISSGCDLLWSPDEDLPTILYSNCFAPFESIKLAWLTNCAWSSLFIGLWQTQRTGSKTCSKALERQTWKGTERDPTNSSGVGGSDELSAGSSQSLPINNNVFSQNIKWNYRYSMKNR